jgi:hypothetical protein
VLKDELMSRHDLNDESMLKRLIHDTSINEERGDSVSLIS